MSLQEIFYTLAILYFISMWVVLIAVGVVLYSLYKRAQQLQRKVHGVTTSLPLLTFVLPMAGRVFRWWRHR